MNKLLNPFIKILSSYLLACILFFLLFLLVVFGTLNQVNHGIYYSQKIYFESFWVSTNLEGLPIFLPGGYLVLLLLALNTICGIIKRMKFNRKKLGLWIVHFSILFLFFSSMITHQYSIEGMMNIAEGEKSNEFKSYYQWGINISTEIEADQEVQYFFNTNQHSTGKVLKDVEIPFEVKIDSYHRNAVVKPYAPMFVSKEHTVDGFFIATLPMSPENENNIPACQILITNKSASVKAILSGISKDTHAYQYIHNDKIFYISLKRKTWYTPFAIQLHSIERDLYPGTMQAKAYRSKIDVLEQGHNESHEIYMNHPLRRNGYTFFQSQYIENPETKQKSSAFSVVKNPSDHWPLYALILLTIGLLIHYLPILKRYINKAATTTLLIFSLILISHESKAEEGIPHWQKSHINAIKDLPILSEGRIKPLQSYARSALLNIYGKKAFKNNGQKMDAIAWLLTHFYLPELTKDWEQFLLDDTQILEMFDLKVDARRTHISYSLLEEKIPQIIEKARIYNQKEDKHLEPYERVVLQLAYKINLYESLIHAFDFAQLITVDMPVLGDTPLNPPQLIIGANQLLETLNLSAEFQTLDQKTKDATVEKLKEYTQMASLKINMSQYFEFIPIEKENKSWYSGTDLLLANDLPNEFKNLYGLLQEITSKAKDPTTDPNQLNQLFEQWKNLNQKQSFISPHLSRINLEIKYNEWDLIYISLLIFIFAFLSTSFQIIKPKIKSWYFINIFLASSATLTLCIAITMRCILLSRAPVSTLYETIIFITAIGCITTLFIEWKQKNIIYQYLCVILGAVGLFLSYKYELSEGKDTLKNLNAVLNSNFWLSTHVTCIVIGYSAGLVAAAVSHVFLISKVLKLTESNKFYQELNKVTYGILCYCLFFSIIGTILGGIWANYSWGRFWGWDPKENGALAIVLWTLIILHARMGGIIKPFGVAILSVLNAIVISASWWGVNELGVGLHSYGFTSGTSKNLTIFWIIESVLILFAIIHLQFSKKRVSP